MTGASWLGTAKPLDERWHALFMDDFHQTLAKFGVPEREGGELDAIVESMKDDIVTSAAPRRAPVIAPGQLMAGAHCSSCVAAAEFIEPGLTYRAVWSCASIRSSSEALRSCLMMVIAIQ